MCAEVKQGARLQGCAEAESVRALDATSVGARHFFLSMLGKECLWEVASHELLVLSYNSLGQ